MHSVARENAHSQQFVPEGQGTALLIRESFNHLLEYALTAKPRSTASFVVVLVSPMHEYSTSTAHLKLENLQHDPIPNFEQ